MEDQRKNISAAILEIDVCMGIGKYLGLPSMIGRSKKSIFNYIKDRVWNRVSSLSSKMLSQAGREVLIKSVAQAIPSYCMSVFLLPNSIEEEIQRMMNSFWWGSKKGDKKGINWICWDKLTMRKEWGGMGFRDIYAFNLAIIWSSRILLNEGYHWKVGNGALIDVWNSPWFRCVDDPKIQSAPPQNFHLSKVHSLINFELGEWDTNLINHYFDPRDAKEILQKPLLHLSGLDTIIWCYDKAGHYTVKSAYQVCMERLVNRDELKLEGNWKSIWSMKVPPKVCNVLTTEQQSIFGMTLWSLWKRRNLQLWDAVTETSATVLARAAEVWRFWDHAPGGIVAGGAQMPTFPTTWNAPPQGTIKCNIDAANFRDQNLVGTGLCLRDSGGKFIVAHTTWIKATMEAAESEP